jgi:hypothetical protein
MFLALFFGKQEVKQDQCIPKQPSPFYLCVFLHQLFIRSQGNFLFLKPDFNLHTIFHIFAEPRALFFSSL